MKLVIDDYEVEIKARNRYTHSDKANKEDTLQFLVTVSILASEASDKFKADGCEGLSDWAERYRKATYDFAKSKGHFKKYEGAEE